MTTSRCIAFVAVATFLSCASSGQSPPSNVSDAGSALDPHDLTEGGTDSALPGVLIQIVATKTSFTLAEAAAGIKIDYQIRVTEDLSDVVRVSQEDGDCLPDDPSDLGFLAKVSGAHDAYCICDVGLCGRGSDPVTLRKGTYRKTFAWNGYNWRGPSDFGQPLGPPFPPGSYSLVIGAKGTRLGRPYEVKDVLALTLTP